MKNTASELNYGNAAAFLACLTLGSAVYFGMGFDRAFEKWNNGRQAVATQRRAFLKIKKIPVDKYGGPDFSFPQLNWNPEVKFAKIDTALFEQEKHLRNWAAEKPGDFYLSLFIFGTATTAGLGAWARRRKHMMPRSPKP